MRLPSRLYKLWFAELFPFSITGTITQFKKKNTHKITEIGYKTRLGKINFKAGLASVIENGKSSANQSLYSLDGSLNLENGDQLNTTVYKVRFEKNF